MLSLIINATKFANANNEAQLGVIRIRDIWAKNYRDAECLGEGGIDEIRDILKNRHALRPCGTAVT